MKDKSVAAIQGTEKIVEKSADAAGNVITTTVKDTAKVAGEVGTDAKDLALGTIEGAKKLGVRAEGATAAVAAGALTATGEVSAAAFEAVRHAAAKPHGVNKPAVKTPDASLSRN